MRKIRPIGIHVSLWTPQWTDDIVEHIHTAARIGFNSVELPIMDSEIFPTERCLHAVSEHNMQVYCGTGLNPSTEICSSDASIRTQGMKHIKRCISIAAKLGSPTLEGVLHSAWGRKVPLTTEERIHMVTNLHELGTYAENFGVSLCLECLNRYESAVLNTTSQGLELLEEINHPSVKIHLDTYHMNIEEDSISGAIIAAGKHLGFLHLSENQRGYPGSGHLPWPEIFNTIIESPYTGPLVIESYVSPSYPLSPDVSIWRYIEPDTSESLQKSLRFVQSFFSE
jgi:D-psicose/D-tagatose/L-ribulose 3-epimerase